MRIMVPEHRGGGGGGGGGGGKTRETKVKKSRKKGKAAARPALLLRRRLAGLSSETESDDDEVEGDGEEEDEEGKRRLHLIRRRHSGKETSSTSRPRGRGESQVLAHEVAALQERLERAEELRLFAERDNRKAQKELEHSRQEAAKLRFSNKKLQEELEERTERAQRQRGAIASLRTGLEEVEATLKGRAAEAQPLVLELFSHLQSLHASTVEKGGKATKREVALLAASMRYTSQLTALLTGGTGASAYLNNENVERLREGGGRTHCDALVESIRASNSEIDLLKEKIGRLERERASQVAMLTELRHVLPQYRSVILQAQERCSALTAASGEAVRQKERSDVRSLKAVAVARRSKDECRQLQVVCDELEGSRRALLADFAQYKERLAAMQRDDSVVRQRAQELERQCALQESFIGELEATVASQREDITRALELVLAGSKGEEFVPESEFAKALSVDTTMELDPAEQRSSSSSTSYAQPPPPRQEELVLCRYGDEESMPSFPRSQQQHLPSSSLLLVREEESARASMDESVISELVRALSSETGVAHSAGTNQPPPHLSSSSLLLRNVPALQVAGAEDHDFFQELDGNGFGADAGGFMGTEEAHESLNEHIALLSKDIVALEDSLARATAMHESTASGD